MDIQIRNYRDFYFLFNQITENCFKRCANPCLNRVITPNEDLCIKNCTNKHVNTNHKIMELYMEIQPVLVRKRIEEMNNTQAATMAQSEDKQEVGIS
ncbi:PREDICTED: mitochondrial import inner membrane translocase subunit Tim10 B [Polistes dominula]|uniref:Mitochondrial import inner membrane translocase subunit n=1 Tax=Polistes dominula TaxID=743375 RepID=A0ABM1JE96_POLDO|nr:PREDICTED: mitochondrial import inner membrane translocase subunit Tim10 B [Polistes dominula]